MTLSLKLRIININKAFYFTIKDYKSVAVYGGREFSYRGCAAQREKFE